MIRFLSLHTMVNTRMRWNPLRPGLLGLLILLSACTEEQAPIASYEVAHKGVFSAALTDDGRYALIGSLTHGGSLWQTDNRERLFNWNHQAGSYTPITVSSITRQGGYALTVESNQLVLWNAVDGKALTYFVAPANILDAQLGPDGRYALLGLADTTAVLFDAKRGGVKRTLHHDGRVWSVSMDAGGTLALTGGEDGLARLWNIEEARELRHWEHDNEVRLAVLSADGSTALTVAKYDRAAVWDTSTGMMIGRLPQSRWRMVRGEVFTAGAISADNALILTGSTSRGVHLYQMPGPTLVTSWSLTKRENWKRSSAAVVAVSFTQTDGEYLAVSADGFIHRLRR